MGYSETVNQEIKFMIDSAYQRAKVTLESKRVTLDAIAQALLDKETIPGSDVRHIYQTTL